jgi:hypothetical protein
MSRPKPKTKPVAKFETFLADADSVALRLLETHGVMITYEALGRDEHNYFRMIEPLVQKHVGRYSKTDADDCVTFEERDHDVVVAHMVGLAMGLRLAKIGEVRR